MQYRMDQCVQEHAETVLFALLLFRTVLVGSPGLISPEVQQRQLNKRLQGVWELDRWCDAIRADLIR